MPIGIILTALISGGLFYLLGKILLELIFYRWVEAILILITDSNKASYFNGLFPYFTSAQFWGFGLGVYTELGGFIIPRN